MLYSRQQVFWTELILSLLLINVLDLFFFLSYFNYIFHVWFEELCIYSFVWIVCQQKDSGSQESSQKSVKDQIRQAKKERERRRETEREEWWSSQSTICRTLKLIPKGLLRHWHKVTSTNYLSLLQFAQ